MDEKVDKTKSSSPEEVERAKYLNNYRTVDPSFQSDRSAIQAVVDTILSKMKPKRLIKRISDDDRKVMTALVLNLYVNCGLVLPTLACMCTLKQHLFVAVLRHDRCCALHSVVCSAIERKRSRFTC